MNQSDEYVSKWKQNEAKEPLNIIDTRTFAERVEECLTIEAFRAWLESKDGDEIVGVAAHSRECPIHDFLHTHFVNECDVEIFTTEAISYGAPGQVGSATLPAFAKLFVQRTDFTPCKSQDGVSVTAEEALAILAEVEKELADTSD